MTRTAYETDAWIPVGPYWDNEEGETGLETYDVQEFIREVDGGTVCRLLVFRSSRRREEFETRVQADLDGVESLLEAVTKRRFACEIDAERAMEEAKKDLRNRRFWRVDLSLDTAVTEKRPRGRPGKNPRPSVPVTE
ncbi:MAG: hypothetical protein WBJ06_07350 [Candidatus Methanoculleus thermohydrogenotrophicum]|nr:hypothetical protein [Candidatus Methanoculleus thermohydrogenotrophicum]NLM82820.1 hypothetical protein [Candidatus Methanoculleus thermohydrogenotrophicum]HQC91428.1 hypothetical protein [Candidatus Methanoculleus thermohydrogenotrophicum]